MSLPISGGSVLVGYSGFEPAPGPYMGYVRSLHLNRDLISQHLDSYYVSGQRRMSIACYYNTVGDTFALESKTGRLVGQDETNLINLINDILNKGFEGIYLEMIPNHDPIDTDELLYGVISFVFDVYKKAKQVYPEIGIDVWAEALSYGFLFDPATGVKKDRYWEQLKLFWRAWCDQFGPEVTTGFSILDFDDKTMTAMKEIYGDTWPGVKLGPVWNIHVDTQDRLDTARNALISHGFSGPTWGPFLIGECAPDSVFTNLDHLLYEFVWPARLDGIKAVQNTLTTDYKPLAIRK